MSMDAGAGGRHMLTCFVEYLPWQPTAGSWEQLREPLGDQVTRMIGRYAPNMPPASWRVAC